MYMYSTDMRITILCDHARVSMISYCIHVSCSRKKKTLFDIVCMCVPKYLDMIIYLYIVCKKIAYTIHMTGIIMKDFFFSLLLLVNVS
jgi:hypothetical protein